MVHKIIPRYSICMCNYNMADTLARSLTTILNQIDERFEVLVVDDGSSDNSLTVLEDLQKKYPALRVHPLPRDRKRKLGFTRNVSVKKARGEYVLLHLDCDDVFEPFLIDFTIVFHQIEKCIGRDILLSGQHINMGKRDFLLSHGPYRNMFRGQDRDLWARMAAIDAYIPLDHINFVTRLPKPLAQRYRRSFFYTWNHILNDFRTGKKFWPTFFLAFKKQQDFTFKFRIYRLLVMPVAFIVSKFCEPFTLPPAVNTFDKIISYHIKTRGTFDELMKRFGGQADFSVLRSDEARAIFKNGA